MCVCIACADLYATCHRKLAVFSEQIQLRIVEVLTAFVNNVTDGVSTVERSNEPDEVAQYRSAFKVSVYFLIMTLTALSHQLLQQEKDIVAKVLVSCCSIQRTGTSGTETVSYVLMALCRRKRRRP